MQPFKLIVLCSFIFIGCQKDVSIISKQNDAQAVSSSTSTAVSANSSTPPFNIEAILRGDDNAFGLVKFRQNNDAARIITLDVWVRDLLPNHSYLLQRAVDTNLDGICTSTSWLTLGQGTQPEAIATDDSGTGRADLFRDLSAVAVGKAFDIHFQVIDAESKAVVLTSDCYRFVVR